ncbi:MAG: hypothetical protein IBJ03_14600 [Gemmatimonadaceae bacterium]|nr:hypothetical protein [Gemmatimonadaceae bacterium]
MHRHDASCHWCGERGKGFTVSSTVWRTAATLLLAAGTGTAVWSYAPAIRDFGDAIARDVQRDVQRDLAADDASRARNVAASMNAAATAQPVATVASAATLAGSALIDSSTTTASADGQIVSPYASNDSITWTPAVARTWVNVRSDASRGGEVVGVIKPASRAMLGTDRAGWRQVRSTDVSGWVDPRLFEADSLRTRGD